MAAENIALFSDNFFWRPETAENKPKAAENSLFSATNALFRRLLAVENHCSSCSV
jgi:hypothetical protein